MSEGTPLLSLHGSGSLLSSMRLPHMKLNDGVWHHIALEVQSDPSEPRTQHLLLTADYGQDQVKVDFPSDLLGSILQNLSVGGVASEGGGVHQGFRGCIQVRRGWGCGVIPMLRSLLCRTRTRGLPAFCAAGRSTCGSVSLSALSLRCYSNAALQGVRGEACPSLRCYSNAALQG
ncbi:hypothetical protein FKM82_017411, partial [Ascaphus truei]